MNVDAIQSANVVRVVGDQGYAAPFSGLQLNQSAHSKDFARTTNTALDARNPADHCTTRRRRGRSSQPLAGLLMQRARRRGVYSHHTPRPQIDSPSLFRRRAHARWSAL